MDYSFKPCHFTDNLHDLPKEAIGKLLKFSGDDSVVVKRHLNMFTCVMILYCRFPQYNNEDFKMRLFVRSLEGDALNWFNNFPNDFFTSLQDILNAFKDRYDSPNNLPSTSKIVEQKESNSAVEERFQGQNVSSTRNIADHHSEKSGINDNEKEEQKQIIQDLKMLVKNLESNQTNLINDVKTLRTHLEKRNREIEVTQSHHAKEIEAIKTNYETEIRIMQSRLSVLEENMVTMKANHDREIDSMTFNHNNQLDNMQANHKEEINFMQHYLMDIKEKNNKMIKDMEEHHARQIGDIKVEHSRQMDAIRIQVQRFQQLEDERNQQTSTDQESSHLLQQDSSYYEEVIDSIERWLIEGDSDRLHWDDCIGMTASKLLKISPLIPFSPSIRSSTTLIGQLHCLT